MYYSTLSRVGTGFIVLAIIGSLAAIGCAQQRPSAQSGVVTPPVVDLSPEADETGPSLGAANTAAKPPSPAPPANIADLEGLSEGDKVDGADQLPWLPADGPRPIADAEKGSPPPAPADTAGGQSSGQAAKTAAEADTFHPPLKSVEQRLDELERNLEFHRQAILEMSDATSIEQRLEKIESDLADLRNSFNSVAKIATGDQQPVNKQPTSKALGLLVVENQTEAAYPMTINGYRFLVGPGRHPFKVPVGEVVTRLDGYEDAKTWRAGDWREVDGQQQLAIQIQ